MAAKKINTLDIYGMPSNDLVNVLTLILVIDTKSKLSKLASDMSKAHIFKTSHPAKTPIFEHV